MPAPYFLRRERKTLPKFARALAPEAVTLAQLRTAVRAELKAADKGENPLSTKEYTALIAWLNLNS